MENSTKYILIVVAIFVILFSAAFVYQQKTINNLKDELRGTKSAEQYPISSIIDSSKEIKGLITTINDNSFNIEAEVFDLSKLNNIKREEQAGSSFPALPKIKKTYTVAVNNNTKYPSSIEFQKLKVGMEIRVISKNSIYKGDELIASDIIVLSGLPHSLQEAIESQRKIAGTIKEIGDGYLKVEMHWLDYTKISNPKNVDPKTAPTIVKEYKVFVSDKTVYAIDKNSLKVDDAVIAHSDSPTFSVAEFTAIKIEKSNQAPSK